MQGWSRRFAVGVAAILLLGMWSTTALAAGTATFGMHPVKSDPNNPATQSYFVFDAAPGRHLQSEVLVRNSGGAAGTVLLYAVDGTTGATSGTVFVGSDAPRQSVGAWITLDQQTLTLGPGEERKVGFTVIVPADATPGQHVGGLVAENAKQEQAAPGGTLRVNVRSLVQTAVQVNLPGPVVEKVAVTDVSPGGQQGDQTLVVAMKNAGTQMIKPKGTVLVTDATGKTVQDLPVQMDTFLPGTAIQYPLQVQKQALGEGRYFVAVHLTYGSSGVTDYQQAFSITPAQVAQVFASQPKLAAPPLTVAKTAPFRRPWLVLGGVLVLAIGLGGGIGFAFSRRRR